MRSESRNNSTDKDILRIFWRAGLRNKRELFWSLINPVGSVFNGMFTPYLISIILAGLAKGTEVSGYFLPLIIVAIIGILANRIGFAKLMEFQAKTQSQLQTDALEGLLKHSVGFHNDRIGGKLVSDAIDFPVAFGAMVSAIFVDIIPFFLITLGGIILVSFHSMIMGTALLFLIAITIWLAWRDSRKRAGLRLRRLAANKEVTSHLSDVVVNTQTVKTFAREKEELRTHRSLNSTLQQLRLHDWTRAARSGNNRLASLMIMEIIFIFIIVSQVRKNPAILAIGIFAFSYTITLTNRLFEIGIIIRQIEEAFLNATPMVEILNSPVSIEDVKNAKNIVVAESKIDFRNITFHYADSSENNTVFAGLNLSVKSGEKIGLVGPSGGGKSTLTRLLLRFEDLTDGSITIDDQDISQVTQSSLRKNISYVPQEPLMFHRSIRENIAYGEIEASDEEIIQVAEQANADEFINKLSNKYHTLVGERGVKLSGGQRQRVAIARALLKNAPILMLDEATSALDSESEGLIQEALWKLMEGRTAIVIAHRLSTIQKMDRIVVLEDGQITEQGTHKELLDKHGTYARLWNHQSGGFIED